MREDQAFADKSHSVKHADLQGMPRRLRISAVKYEPIGKDREMRPVVYFEKAQKGLILNRTNWRSLARLLGEDSDEWRGGVIELFSSTTEYAGETVGCVRVRGLGRASDPFAPPSGPPRHEPDDPRTTSDDPSDAIRL